MAENFPYRLLNKIQLIDTINLLASQHQAFLFIIDYKSTNGYIIKADDLDNKHIKFQISNSANPTISTDIDDIEWQLDPISFENYERKHNYIQTQIRHGNSFLVNLTQPTPISTNITLLDIYNVGVAKYKLWLKDKFTVLSPESFVIIRGNSISSYPMKGTIDANLPNAAQIIINDTKEKAEHATIVDLIRNDLSMVCSNVELTRFRYIEKLQTNKGNLLQVSSEITGKLPIDFYNKLGDIIFQLLPAGSICGAPKPKTLEIINSIEGYERGFYTGIFGWFDGYNMDSAVMIRFIEQSENGLVFKSGGGITSQSIAKKEYNELIQKVYVPIS